MTMSTEPHTPHDAPNKIPQLTQQNLPTRAAKSPTRTEDSAARAEDSAARAEAEPQDPGESGETPRRVGENSTLGDPNADAPRGRLGVDWTAVLVAAVIVAVALFGLLPSIPFLVK
jgi:hypothetical protein